MSDVTTAPTWRERITGRWALSWQAYVLGVLVNLPLLVVTGGRIGTRIVPASDMGVLFHATSAVLGLLFLGLTARLARSQDAAGAMRVFSFSITYLTVLFLVMVADVLVVHGV